MSERQGMLKKVVKFFSFSDPDPDEMEDMGMRDRELRTNDKVVQLPKRARHAEISIFEPNAYEDALVLSDSLKEGHTVIINLNKLDVTLATRILDFVSGIIHYTEGSFKKVGDNIFVFAPQNIRITPESELRAATPKDRDNVFYAER